MGTSFACYFVMNRDNKSFKFNIHWKGIFYG
jgi:hypothetical protein